MHIDTKKTNHFFRFFFSFSYVQHYLIMFYSVFNYNIYSINIIKWNKKLCIWSHLLDWKKSWPYKLYVTKMNAILNLLVRQWQFISCLLGHALFTWDKSIECKMEAVKIVSQISLKKGGDMQCTNLPENSSNQTINHPLTNRYTFLRLLLNLNKQSNLNEKNQPNPIKTKNKSKCYD